LWGFGVPETLNHNPGTPLFFVLHSEHAQHLPQDYITSSNEALWVCFGFGLSRQVLLLVELGSWEMGKVETDGFHFFSIGQHYFNQSEPLTIKPRIFVTALGLSQCAKYQSAHHVE
jgi:hypothetical protein